MSGGGGGYDDLDLCLPLEICSEILTRVPIKSILRFRSVCKPWLSLISCPNFKPKTLSDRILLQRHDCRSGGEWAISSHDESFSESRDIGDDLPDRFRGKRLDPIGSCDGLICLYDHRVDRSKEESIYSFLIYNPAIRKIVELPSLRFALETHRPRYYGFGFDSKASDYKVMLVLAHVYIEARDCDWNIEIKTSYMGFMFDLRNGAWREFTPIMKPNHMGSLMCCPKFYVNDALHWYGFIDHEHVLFLLSFNLSDETFRVMSLPAELSYPGGPMIITSGGLIYALAEDMPDPCRSVWVMKEYGVTESWTKLFTVDMPPMCSTVKYELYPLIFRGPEVVEFLMSYFPGGEDEEEGCVEVVEYVHLLISYNSESGESECLFEMTNESIMMLVFYKESLVLM